ncbi:MAG TPA: DnaJ domain-containing protein [Streptosporangiaceae bacterium]|nr:DnaJ domain-containing protein [Streptosporangiaceae bacterium]
MNARRDYYQVLGVPRDADAKALKKAFRQLARRYHPDTSTEPDAEQPFFSGKTSAATKITLLQNGQAFTTIINAQSGSSMARSASAKVTKVTVTSSAQATVTYNILLGTTPALTNQSGLAVYQNGTWKVGDASFCTLLALENGGKAPSVCSSAG